MLVGMLVCALKVSRVVWWEAAGFVAQGHAETCVSACPRVRLCVASILTWSLCCCSVRLGLTVLVEPALH